MSLFSILGDIFSPLTWLINKVGNLFKPNISGGNTILTPPPLPEALPPPSTAIDPRVGLAKEIERRRAILIGRQSTVLTTGVGLLDDPNTTAKTLLGE